MLFPSLLSVSLWSSLLSSRRKSGWSSLAAWLEKWGEEKPLKSLGSVSNERKKIEERMVRLAGIEPATCGFEVRRSILLSYRRLWEEDK